jgi:hypothetical protein
VFTLTCLGAGAQVTIRFMPQQQGATVQGLAFAQVMNNSKEDFRGYLTIRVGSMNGKKILELQTAVQNFRIGVNGIDPAAFSKAVIRYGNHEQSDFVRNTGRFPEGELEYCFNLVVTDAKDPALAEFENCFTQLNQPFTPLLLVDPIDGDEVCNLRPNFLWQPPMPIPPGSFSRLVLVHMQPKQDPVLAIVNNTPVIVQQGIAGNILTYPSQLPDLAKDRNYAWQVVVYSGSTVITRSEIWTFKTACGNTVQELDEKSYRELKEEAAGETLLTRGALRFAIRNPYESGPLSYYVVPMENQDKKIRNLPKLQMRNGLNQYSLDLESYNAFKAGEEYMLVVEMKNGRKSYLRFVFTYE